MNTLRTDSLWVLGLVAGSGTTGSCVTASDSELSANRARWAGKRRKLSAGTFMRRMVGAPDDELTIGR
jgi:hypothetical protein